MAKEGKPNHWASETMEKSINLYAGKNIPMTKVKIYPPISPVKIEMVLKKPLKKIVALPT